MIFLKGPFEIKNWIQCKENQFYFLFTKRNSYLSTYASATGVGEVASQTGNLAMLLHSGSEIHFENIRLFFLVDFCLNVFPLWTHSIFKARHICHLSRLLKTNLKLTQKNNIIDLEIDRSNQYFRSRREFHQVSQTSHGGRWVFWRQLFQELFTILFSSVFSVVWVCLVGQKR